MSRRSCKLLAVGIAATVMAGASQRAIAQAQSQGAPFTLGDNDGIFVDKSTFKAIKGNGAKGDPATTLAKLGAREVSAGAIIYRYGDKLYIIDGTPPKDASPQFMKTLQDWCPTCNWYTPGSYMK